MTIAPILMHHQITNTFNSKGNHAGHEITWKFPPYPWLFSTLQHFWEFFQTCIKPQHSASIPRWNKTLWRKLNLHVSHFCRTNSPTFISNENHHIHRSILPFSQKFTKIYIKQKSSPSMFIHRFSFQRIWVPTQITFLAQWTPTELEWSHLRYTLKVLICENSLVEEKD